MTSPDRRAAAEKVRLGYAAYTPPAVGSAPTQAQGSAAGPQPQKQRRSRGQGPAAAEAPRMNGVVRDHLGTDKVHTVTIEHQEWMGICLPACDPATQTLWHAHTAESHWSASPLLVVGQVPTAC